jgi:putative methyltransferase
MEDFEERAAGRWEEKKLSDEINVTEKQKKEVLDACIRCDKGTEDGTMGFFVAAFVRDQDAAQNGVHNGHNVVAHATEEGSDDEEEEEWNGFSDEEAAPTQPVSNTQPNKKAKTEPVKRNRHSRKVGS